MELAMKECGAKGPLSIKLAVNSQNGAKKPNDS
jgi:hypothetical protein